MSKPQVSMRAIEFRLEWLNKALGRPTKSWSRTPDGKNKSNPGNFHLDHDHSGYRVEMMLEGGGADPVFGHARMSKAQLLDQLEAILVAIKLAQNENYGSNWPKID